MNDKRASRATMWKALLGPAVVLALSVAAASCGGGAADGACSLDDSSTCKSGQVCLAGKDGVTFCGCSTKTGDGCAAGEVCVAGSSGAPECVVCSIANNEGCSNGQQCVKSASGAPECVACSTATNEGCDGTNICVEDAMGVPACVACSIKDNTGCDATSVCVADPMGMPVCAVCSTVDNKGCTDGQVCAADKMGVLGCFCSVTANTGCADGKVCLADPDGVPACYCATETEAGCATGTVCEEVPGGYPTCFPPLTIGGQVFDLATNAPIGGAHVVGRDANFAAVTGVAVTDAAGKYSLVVPAPRKADGTPLASNVFMRADAQTYVTFPTAPRVALPIDLSKATGSPPLLDTSATHIGMIQLADPAGLGSISGKVLAPVPVGTLVVAGGSQSTGGGATGIAGTDGSYTVFNVAAGTVAVHGYKVGLQSAEASANVVAGAETMNVDLVDKGAATSVVSGSVQIVNGGMGTSTSVILAVEETFNPTAARGEAPPGLRAAPVSGAFSITGVPDGNYVVLAAFENDFLVRDPDTSIGGTQIAHIKVAGGDVAISTGFKVTGSLDVVSPDAEAVVSGVPKFVWVDDSGENHYEVRVFDAYGNLVWEKLDVPGVSGGANVTVDYGGPALVSGRLYQFRAVSIKNGGSPLSTTEDLRGVFLYQ